MALELARQQQACGQPLGSCVAISAALLPEQLAELWQQQQQTTRSEADGAGGTPVLITRGTLDKGGQGVLPPSVAIVASVFQYCGLTLLASAGKAAQTASMLLSPRHVPWSCLIRLCSQRLHAS